MKCWSCGDVIPLEYMLSADYVTGTCETCDPYPEEDE